MLNTLSKFAQRIEGLRTGGSAEPEAILDRVSSEKQKTVDTDYLDRARREALRRDFRLLTPGQRVEQAAALSKEMTGLVARRAEQG